MKITATGNLVKDTDLANLAQVLNYSQTYTLTNGTSSNQANMFWADTRTLTASSSDDLDVAGGLTNAFGDTITFTKLKGIIVFAAAANTNNVLIGGDAASIATLTGNINDVIVVRPGGFFAVCAPDATGYAVTATTADILQIANSAGSTSVTYDIILIGTV
jgi:hypothetical protein